MPKTARKTESGILSAVRESVAGLRRAGLVDEATMRKFDALCLAPVARSSQRSQLSG
jgi:putative transcriptional regulator